MSKRSKSYKHKPYKNPGARVQRHHLLGCYGLQYDEARFDFIYMASGGFKYVKVLRCAYITGGPQEAFGTWNRVKGHGKMVLNLAFTPEKVLKYITMPLPIAGKTDLEI